MKKRILIGVLTCSILLSGCGLTEFIEENDLGNLIPIDKLLSFGDTEDEDESEDDEEDNEKDNKEDNEDDDEKEDKKKDDKEDDKEDDNDDDSADKEASVDYSTVVPLSVSNPEEYERLNDEAYTLNEKLTGLDYNSQEYRDTKWRIDDINEELYGDIAGKLEGSDITMEEFGGSFMEYTYAVDGRFADELRHGKEFSDKLKEGDTIMVFDSLSFVVDKVRYDDKLDPTRVTGYQLSYSNNSNKAVDVNLSDLLGKYTAAGCEFNGERYEVVWHEGRKDVTTNFDSITEGAYTISSEHLPSLGVAAPTIYRRISVTDYVELYNLQAADNWYFGDWKVKRNGDFYEIAEDTGMFSLEDISRGHCTIMMDSENRYMDHAVLDVSWLDQEGNAVTYYYHLDADWNAYKMYTYPQSIQFDYAG